VTEGMKGSEAALRALRAAGEEIEALRRGPWEGPEARGRVLRVANAIDRALRRYLRDDEDADLSVRLQALAPDEMSADAVLGELRRNERISMDLAANIHELFGTRRQLERGADADEREALRAVRVADRFTREIEAASSTPRRVAAPPPVADVREPAPASNSLLGEEAHEVPRRARRRSGAGGPKLAAYALGGVAVVLLLLAVVWMRSDRGPNHLDEGIALFRSGAFTEAAHHFWRYAEANPRDATPHLYLARIHRRLERHELAAESIREAQRLAPEDPAVHRELGFLLLDTGQASVAVERFQHAIELDPESSEGWVGLVRAMRESGRAAEVDAVIQRAPAEVRALLGRE
jgi:tetratricopeptide (TPR) repeat protein